jgi:hypothetical protein
VHKWPVRSFRSLTWINGLSGFAMIVVLAANAGFIVLHDPESKAH